MVSWILTVVDWIGAQAVYPVQPVISPARINQHVPTAKLSGDESTGRNPEPDQPIADESREESFPGPGRHLDQGARTIRV